MSNHRGGTRVKRKRTPSPEWQAFQATLLHPDQIAYEVIRPVVTLGQDLTSRAAEVGLAPRTLARKVEQFVQFSIPGLIASSTRKPDDKRLLPPAIRDYILQLKAEHALLTPREIATIVEVRFDRSIGRHTIERVVARGPLPKLSRRRFPFYRQLRATPARREAILRLHLEGWSAPAIISYLHAPRTTVYDFLQRWVQDAVVKPLGDRKRGRPPGARKATLPAVAAIKQLQEVSAIGAFRMAAALKQQYGIVLSPRTCGRIMAKNRELYGLWAPPHTSHAPAKPKKPMPFATSIPHRWWSVDLCYIEQHHLPNINRPVYIWTILDNASRQIVASAPSKTQTLWDFLLVLFTAIHVYGAPIGLVSDSGSVFTANAAVELYQRLGIEKAQIERRRPWQNYVESSFNIMKHMEGYQLAQATNWEAFCAVHARWVADYNYQDHFAHQDREDGLHTPVEVLQGARGRLVPIPTLQDIFELLMHERRVRQSGYIRYANWHIYGQEGLGGQRAGVLLMKETLTIAYGSQMLAQYQVTSAPDGHGRRTISAVQDLVAIPPWQRQPAPQRPLWDEPTMQEIEWRKVYPARPYAPRRRKTTPKWIQRPLLSLFA